MAVGYGAWDAPKNEGFYKVKIKIEAYAEIEAYGRTCDEAEDRACDTVHACDFELDWGSLEVEESEMILD